MKTIRKFSDGFCNFMKISVYEKNKNIRKTYIMTEKLIIVKK